MSAHSQTFLANGAVKTEDREHRRKINFNMAKYDAAVVKGKEQFSDLHLARERAKNTKWKAIGNLDKMLDDFEKAITKRGAKVIWARDSADALEAIGNICREKNCKMIVKSKSMVTEEIHLNDFLEKQGITSIETDLGEYIQQLDGEPPYHIVTPAMHKSKEDVARLFAEKLGTDPQLTPVQLTQVAREKLRKKYAEADIGITGANFIISDIGAVAVSENEGNARLSCSMPKTHIVITGLEKVIPSLNDLALFWPLLATYGTGQQITVYNSVICGPKQPGETDGPEDMYVILLDNGRTNLLINEKLRESLYCIRCGACLNACPVYKNIGGHSYETSYSGPIGSVITPHLRGMSEWKHLSFASSLCGNCTEVCPVKINLHELLLENRHESVEKKQSKMLERIGWRFWKIAMMRRFIMNAGTRRSKNWVVNRLLKGWKKHRTAIEFPEKSFNRLWKEYNRNR